MQLRISDRGKLTVLYFRTFIGLILSALLPIPLVLATVASETTIVGNEDFQDAFAAYYHALGTFSSDDLVLELSETLEDALISGSHLSQTSLSYRVRQIKATLLGQISEELCTANEQSLDSLNSLKGVAVRSIIATSEKTAVNFDPETVGMIAGVVVRLVQATPRSELCQ